MSKYILPFVFLSLFNISNAMANFGLGPCCPPSWCGIVPCDSGCAGAAINQMGSAVSNSINNLNSAYQDLSDAEQDVLDSLNNLGSDVGNALVNQNNDLLNAISASTNKIELANASSSKSLERNTDHFNKSLLNALKGVGISRSTSNNLNTFGGHTQPLSGETGSNQALSLKKFNQQMIQLDEASTNGFIKYLNDDNSTALDAGKGIHRESALKFLNDFDKLHTLLTVTTLDDADFQDLQTLIAFSISKYPLVKNANPNNSAYELERRRHIALSAMIYHSLMVPTLSRKGLDEALWASYYQDVERNAEGNVGLSGFYHAEIEGKITDPEWWGSTLRLNGTGLEREKTYQAAIAGQLKNRLSTISGISNDLLAILLTKKLESSRSDLSNSFGNL